MQMLNNVSFVYGIIFDCGPRHRLAAPYQYLIPQNKKNIFYSKYVSTLAILNHIEVNVPFLNRNSFIFSRKMKTMADFLLTVLIRVFRTDAFS